ncbi:MAG: hypothetical protein HOO67_01770 [Candidatus Peribacteraceae bacterium]|nr:hypothetical protein [Candidatus Peribacteraceae bacterium]
MPTEPPTDPLLQRLDQIELHLRHLDHRDRSRMIWSTVKSSIGLVMFLTALFGSWYLINNLGEIMKLMVQESAKQSQQMMKSGSEDFLKQVQGLFGGKSSSSSSRSRARTL